MEVSYQMDYLHEQIGSLVTLVPPVVVTENCISVYEQALARRQYRFLPVVDKDNRPLGLVDRLVAIEELSRPFFRDLYRKKAIGELLKPQIPIESTRFIDELAHQITREHAADSQNAFLISENGIYAGVVTFQDLLKEIVERKELHLYNLAHFDNLTGLPNRTLFRDRLEQARQFSSRRDRKIAVVFIDLDGFKFINDTLGHDAGDHVLITIAQRLPPSLRKVDTLSRLGGDEFTLLLPDIKNVNKVREITERMLTLITEPIEFAGETLRVSASMGVAFFPDDGEEIDEVLKRADMAMYEAKAAGKNNCQFFSKKLCSRVAKQQALEQALPLAVENQEFSLLFQPLVALKDSEIIGCEALLSWSYDGRQMQPLEFMPLVEKQRLTLKVTDWMLAEVARQIKAWDKQGLKWLRLAVNLSLLDLQDPKLAQRIGTALEQHGLKPDRLLLEFTDQFGIRDMATMADTLHTLCERGFSLALDDFGKGLSSLSMLRDMPIDLLKLDLAALQAPQGGKKRDDKLLQALVQLAASLEVRVVAEGVADEDGLKRITQAGCYAYQGDYCTPPLTAEELPQFLKQWQKQHKG
ncbi:EAL domain-containing protein [Magnetovirga frankeli]|uniref:putative bifunctional diguanylate cyclase/phosphodiesterase n=1 Tax=Magnetovirga frankeli TaxID=947516 RepID=UPI00129393C7|nr:EAL domain-containing protein [gamma proteobacterium SS-5]